ncbi:hypothetical protein L596_007046 [Steinernema carpocapsae]|uniref:Carboxylesterase type B domain-containing protein n=1 Tax=Steinernema carpocapsae TaxID=34508 RepID=A0A4U5P810_STECR|nr:hypothetical protein L596_007046 [Steinernema carpocapsae]
MLLAYGVLFALLSSVGLGLESRVQTPFGTVEGFDYHSALVFLGIPYAEAPIGDKRFEEVNVTAGWSGVLEVKAFKPSCLATMMDGPWSQFEYAEDCLFLNIMAPKNTDPKGHPVVFYVHGGAFEFDTSTNCGYKKIVDKFVSQGIVFVTFNYRLGPLGFLTTENDALPGNLGLWDQAIALEFVHRIIGYFGGNPSQITAMGQSAGATSVSALTLSEHSHNLVQKSIQISGSFYEIPLKGSRDFGLKFLAKLGCASSEPKSCLKSKSWQEIMDTAAEMGPPASSDKAIGSFYYPYIDHDFLNSDLHSLVRKQDAIPSMIGLNEFEASLFVFDVTNATFIEVPQTDYSTFSGANLKKTFEKIAVNISGLVPLIEDFYVGSPSENITRDSIFYLTQQVNVAGDVAFNVAAFQEAVEKMRANWPVHLFIEEYFSDSKERRKLNPVSGATHCNELPYFFDMDPIYPPGDDFEASAKFGKNLLEGMVSFIKTSYPVVGKTPWEPIGEDDLFKYMALDVTSRMKTGFFKDRMEFWLKEVVRKVDLEELRALLPQATNNLL